MAKRGKRRPAKKRPGRPGETPERPEPEDAGANRAPETGRVTRRLLTLLTTLVNAPQPVPVAEIREALAGDYQGKSEDAAQRMFERDKALLEDLGIPVEFVPPDEDADPDGGGYRVDKNRLFLSELTLTPGEMAVVLLAGSPLLEQEGFPYRHDLRLALNKLRLGSPAEPGPAGHVTVNVPMVHGGPAVERSLDALADGLLRRKSVTIVYRDWQTGAETTRVLDPYGLFCAGGAWYLVAHSHERGAIRQFAVHRIQRASVNPAKPRTPDFELPRGFRLRDWARRPAWKWERHAPVRAIVECAPEVAWLAERKLGATAVPAGDWQRIELEGVTNVDALADWALGFSDRVRAVEPPALVDAVRARLAGVLARYGEAP